MMDEDPNPAAFKRSTQGFPKTAIERSTAAKLKLEKYYEQVIEQTIERERR